MTNIEIIENILVILGEGFWILSSFSQLRKLVKTGDPHGLSAVNQTLNGAGNIAWITYFASRQLFVPIITNATMLIITTMMLAYTLGNKKQFKRGLMAIAIIGPITSLFLIFMSSVSGWVGVVYNLIAVLPWIFHIVSTKKTSGISERSIYCALGAITCTLTYALLIGSPQLITGCLIGVAAQAIVMVYYYRYRNSEV